MIIKLYVCVKDRTCLRIAVPAYYFNIFGSIFGVLFCLLLKKLILGSKTIWQSVRKFLCAIWSVRIFPHMDEKEKTFSWKLQVGMVWIFLDNHLFFRPINFQNNSENLATNFFLPSILIKVHLLKLKLLQNLKNEATWAYVWIILWLNKIARLMRYGKLSFIESYSYYLEQCLSIDLSFYWTPGRGQKGPMNKVCVSFCLEVLFGNSAWC